MRIAALFLGLALIAAAIAGIIATDSAMAFRRMYFETPGRFYAAGAIRLAMGLVVILAARSSRRPTVLRAMGTVMCIQVLAANVFGIERARTIMEWEAAQGNALLRAGAVVALASGTFIAWAVAKRPGVRQR